MNHSSLMLSSEVEKYLRDNTFMFNHFKTKQVYKYILTRMSTTNTCMNYDTHIAYCMSIEIKMLYSEIYRKFKYDSKQNLNNLCATSCDIAVQFRMYMHFLILLQITSLTVVYN